MTDRQATAAKRQADIKDILRTAGGWSSPQDIRLELSARGYDPAEYNINQELRDMGAAGQLVYRKASRSYRAWANGMEESQPHRGKYHRPAPGADAVPADIKARMVSMYDVQRSTVAYIAAKLKTHNETVRAVLRQAEVMEVDLKGKTRRCKNGHLVTHWPCRSCRWAEKRQREKGLGKVLPLAAALLGVIFMAAGCDNVAPTAPPNSIEQWWIDTPNGSHRAIYQPSYIGDSIRFIDADTGGQVTVGGPYKVWQRFKTRDEK